MDKIVLIPNPQKDKDLNFTKRTVEVLSKFCSKIYAEKIYEKSLGDAVTYYEKDAFPHDGELILVLGGDGSVLHAASEALAHDLPLLGINMGRVGYLASVEPDEIENILALKDGNYTESRHMTLAVSVKRSGGEQFFLGNALNDVVVSGRGHLADMRLYDQEQYLEYRADALIAATPTGSTAYSFSAGGPVMDESMDAICVTPVCPRTFFSRSLLFSAESALRIVNTTQRDGDMDVSLDGRTHFLLHYGDEVLINRAEKDVRFVLLKPRRLLEVLCTKTDMRHF